MTLRIDTTFDVYSDTPIGRDPDARSPTLRRYHRLLWSKALPDGRAFSVSADHPKAYLHCKLLSEEFSLSSDSIGHTYRHVKAMAPIINQIADEDLDQFFSICSTIGAYTIFPSRVIDRKPTINASRGLNWKIRDRFDLTLECIRRHYLRLDSPLSETLARYTAFFDLFGSFREYVDFFLLQDMTTGSNSEIRFFMPFYGFDSPPLPKNVDEYQAYKASVAEFVTARNLRITLQTR